MRYMIGVIALLAVATPTYGEPGRTGRVTAPVCYPDGRPFPKGLPEIAEHGVRVASTTYCPEYHSPTSSRVIPTATDRDADARADRATCVAFGDRSQVRIVQGNNVVCDDQN